MTREPSFGKWDMLLKSDLLLYLVSVCLSLFLGTLCNSVASFPQAMIDDVKAAFKQRLGDAEWMDAGTKHAALVKLEAITDMIGYPDYIKVRAVYT